MSSLLSSLRLSSLLACGLLFTLAPACTSTAGDETGDTSSASGTGSSGSGESGEASGSEAGSEGSGSQGTSATSVGDGDGDATSGDGDDTTTSGDGDGDGECVVDTDCQLQNDCCACDGVPVDEEITSCPQTCLIPFCDSIGISEAACVAGQCTIKKLNCDDRTVFCDAPPPDCGEGTRPSVENDCWTGSCVPEVACNYVSRCAACTERELCVEESLNAPGGPWLKCVPVPADCGATPNCACAGDDYCNDGTFDVCNDNDNGITCGCTAC